MKWSSNHCASARYAVVTKIMDTFFCWTQLEKYSRDIKIIVSCISGCAVLCPKIMAGTVYIFRWLDLLFLGCCAGIAGFGSELWGLPFQFAVVTQHELGFRIPALSRADIGPLIVSGVICSPLRGRRTQQGLLGSRIRYSPACTRLRATVAGIFRQCGLWKAYRSLISWKDTPQRPSDRAVVVYRQQYGWLEQMWNNWLRNWEKGGEGGGGG